MPSLLAIAVLALVVAAMEAAAPPQAEAAAKKPRADVLVFTHTVGFRHDSIPAGISAVRRIGKQNRLRVVATEKPSAFRSKVLKGFEAVVFLNTTGDVLPPTRERALKRFIRRGGGFAGVHAAADTEHTWPFYGSLLGARFASHPAIQSASIDVADPAHPSTRALPARWTRTDEWYDFSSNPRSTAHVLLTLDESTYSGGTMGPDHPIAWCQRHARGRSWYTALGHTAESFTEPLFISHLRGGILWAAGLAKASCR